MVTNGLFVVNNFLGFLISISRSEEKVISGGKFQEIISELYKGQSILHYTRNKAVVVMEMVSYNLNGFCFIDIQSLSRQSQ